MTTLFGPKPGAAAPQQFAKVQVSIAGEYFNFAPGAILALKPGEPEWPEPIRTWVQQPAESAIAVLIAEGPPAWANVNVIQIDPEEFTRSITPRTPAPKARQMDRGEVLKHMGMTDAEFDAALTFGFPEAHAKRWHTDKETNATVIEPLWNEFKINDWMARRDALGGTPRTQRRQR